MSKSYRETKSLRSVLDFEFLDILIKLKNFGGDLCDYDDEVKFIDGKSLTKVNHQVRLEEIVSSIPIHFLLQWDDIWRIMKNYIDILANSPLIFIDIQKLKKLPSLLARYFSLYQVTKKTINELSFGKKFSSIKVGSLSVVCCGELITVNGYLTTWSFFLNCSQSIESHFFCLMGLFIDNDDNRYESYSLLIENYMRDSGRYNDKVRDIQKICGSYTKFLLSLSERPNNLRLVNMVNQMEFKYPQSSVMSFLRGLNRNFSIEFCALMKNFGFVTVDIDLNEIYFHQMQTRVFIPSLPTLRDVHSVFKTLFYNSYLRHHGKVPCINGYLYESLVQSKVNIKDYNNMKSISFGKTFDIEFEADASSLIQDTAICPGRSLGSSHLHYKVNKLFFKDGSFGKVPTRRYLTKFFGTELKDLKREITTMLTKGIPIEDRIIKYDIKAGEMKDKGRCFGTSTFMVKLYHMVRTKNLQNFMVYFKEFSGMAMNPVELDEHLFNMANKLNGNTDNIFIMIDFEDFAGTFDLSNVWLILNEIDRLHGCDFKFFMTLAELPMMSEHICSNIYRSASSQRVYNGKRLPNGFDQYSWTMIGICVIYLAVFRIVGENFQLTMTGDNTAILLNFAPFNLPNKSLKDMMLELVIKSISSVASDYGLIVKPDEFNYSNIMMEYLKRIYINGSRVNDKMKCLQKIGRGDESEYQTVCDECSNMSSNLSNISQYMNYSTSPMLLQCITNYINIHSCGVRLNHNQNLILNLSPSIFGRFTSLMPTKFLISGDIDPLTDWIYWMKVVSNNNLQLSTQIKEYNTSLKKNNDQGAYKLELSKNPYYLPFESINSNNKLKNDIIINHIKKNVLNHEIRSLYNNDIASLETCFKNIASKNFEPFLFNLLLSTTGLGLINYYTQKISKCSSFYQLVDKNYLQIPLVIQRRIKKGISDWKVTNIEKYKFENCSRKSADRLRLQVFGFDCSTVSTMHPFEAITHDPSSLGFYIPIIKTNRGLYFGSYERKPSYSTWDSSNLDGSLKSMVKTIMGDLSSYSTYCMQNGDFSFNNLLQKIWSERVSDPLPQYNGPSNKNIINKHVMKIRPNYLKINNTLTKGLVVCIKNTTLMNSKLFTFNYDLTETVCYYYSSIFGTKGLVVNCLDCLYKRRYPVLSCNTNYEAIPLKKSHIVGLPKTVNFMTVTKRDRKIYTVASMILKSMIDGNLKLVLPLVDESDIMTVVTRVNIVMGYPKARYILKKMVNNGIISRNWQMTGIIPMITIILKNVPFPYVRESTSLNLMFTIKPVSLLIGTFKSKFVLNCGDIMLVGSFLSIILIITSNGIRNLYLKKRHFSYVASIFGNLVKYSPNSSTITKCIDLANPDSTLEMSYDKYAFDSSYKFELRRIKSIMEQRGCDWLIHPDELLYINNIV